MASLSAKVELLDKDGRVIETDYAYGNSKRTVATAALSLLRQMRNDHPNAGEGKIGRTKR